MSANEKSGGDEETSLLINTVEDSSPLIEEAPRRSITLLQITVIAYMIIVGGPFGIEPAVGSGGALLTMVGLAVILLFWCTPQFIMSAELALLCGNNGGAVVWVNRAFGDCLNFLNICNVLFSGMCSVALSVSLFTRYWPQNIQLPYIVWPTRAGLLIVCIIVNVLGPNVLSHMTVVITVIMFSPFIILIVLLGVQGKYATANLSASFTDIPPFGEIQWGVLISTLVWSCGGFDNMGAFAGEVAGGKRSYVIGVLLVLPLAFISYMGPMMPGLVAMPNFQNWTAGGYTAITYNVTGWLGDYTTAVACIAMLGQFIAGLSYCCRQLWGCSVGPDATLPSFFSWSRMSKGGVHQPWAAIVTCGIIIVALAAIPYDTLSQVFLLQRILTLYCEYGALIRLRFLEPLATRPFEAPGGKIMSFLWGLPTVAISFFVLYFITDINVWIWSGSIEAFFIVCYIVRYIYKRCYRHEHIELIRMKKQ